ncbi:MAG: hypothetical protein LAO03_01415 [Acidobacteriia bacterium]|nr:hypothetical protein [Terriglobia bacterium]
MRREERIARDYLLHSGFRDIVHEPDGNVPPDFLVEGRIAVEVRRLNQNESTETGYRGLEETSIPFLTRFQRLLTEINSPSGGSSWLVSYAIQRPLPPWHLLYPTLKKYLEAFRDSAPAQSPTSVTMFETLEIEFCLTVDSYSTFFVLASGDDRDQGGWLLDEIDRNLRICIEEKTRKIAPYRQKYAEWWLALVDMIGFSLSETDREWLRKNFRCDHSWNKIALLDPLNPKSSFEIT